MEEKDPRQKFKDEGFMEELADVMKNYEIKKLEDEPYFKAGEQIKNPKIIDIPRKYFSSNKKESNFISELEKLKNEKRIKSYSVRDNMNHKKIIVRSYDLEKKDIFQLFRKCDENYFKNLLKKFLTNREYEVYTKYYADFDYKKATMNERSYYYNAKSKIRGIRDLALFFP